MERTATSMVLGINFCSILNYDPDNFKSFKQWTTEPKIPKFRCFGNFGSVRFGSVRLKNTEPKQIEEFRFNNKLKLHIGSEICKKFSSKSVHGII